MAQISINGDDASAGGIYAPKEVPFGDKGGCIPPCSLDKGFSSAGDTLLGSGLSGLGEYERRYPLIL